MYTTLLGYVMVTTYMLYLSTGYYIYCPIHLTLNYTGASFKDYLVMVAILSPYNPIERKTLYINRHAS